MILQFLYDMLTIIFNVTVHHDTLQITEVVRSKFPMEFVMNLFMSKDFYHLQKCIKIIGNFLAVNQESADYLIKKGLVQTIKEVLPMIPLELKRNTYWVVSNIAANSEKDAEMLIDSSLFVHLILSCTSHSPEERKEAFWAISNIINKIHNETHLQTIINFGLMQAIQPILDRDNENGVLMLLVLTTLKNLLERVPGFRQFIDHFNVHTYIEELQSSVYFEVYKLAAEILERFFGGVEMN